ncbi:MAG: CAP domain-containing protein [Actinomycetota bacterium]|nr:CAP domain-containing protein [Actinomycetota bacterium]
MTSSALAGSRRLAATVVVLVLTVAGLLSAAAPASAGPAEPELVTLANSARTSAGVAPLAVREDLTVVARAWSERMAREGRLYHNPAVGPQVCCWQSLSENVGYSYRGAADVHRLFLGSSGHRANLLNAGSTQVGIGTATDAQGRIWVTQVFRRPTARAATAPATAPAVGPIGAIRDRYLAMGGARSVLGAPLTAELPTPGRVGRYTVFQGGSIYWTPRTGAHEVYGAIRNRWAGERWEAGRLGYPTRGEYDVAGGRATDFERGRIVWERATGRTTIQAR